MSTIERKSEKTVSPVNITIPHHIKVQMDEFQKANVVSWSEVAGEAIEVYLSLTKKERIIQKRRIQKLKSMYYKLNRGTNPSDRNLSVRTCISVPNQLRTKMNFLQSKEYVNWSCIAARAFEQHIKRREKSHA